VSLGNGYTCQIEGICIVHIKLFDGMIRELKDVRYVPQSKKKFDFNWSFGGTNPKRKSQRRRSQDVQ